MTSNGTICSPLDYVFFLDINARVTLAVCFIVLGIAGTLINFLVVVTILKTNQWSSQSTRLILFVSLLDILWAWFGSFVNASYILNSSQTDQCKNRLIIRFITNLTAYSSLGLTIVIGLDRFLHIYFLNDYATKFTPRCFNLVLACYAVVSIFQSTIGLVFERGSAYQGYISLPINSVLVVSTVAMYCYSIKKLNNHLKNQQYLSQNRRSIVRVGSLYLFIFMITFSPGLLVQSCFEVIRDAFGNSVIGLLLSISIMIANLGSSINAVVFLCVNVPAKQFLKYFRCRRRIVHPNIIHVV